MLIRLHKYLADNGVASRRKCEEYIRSGLVKVNGKVVKEMGIKVDPEHDVIETGEQLKMRRSEFVYYAFHKPAGYVCSVTGPEEPKIVELLKAIPERIFPVGRLDKLTSGLLLLTNDGRFAYKLTHPKFEKEKEYVVKIREKITPELLRDLAKRFFIHGKQTQPATVTSQGNHLLRIVLKEGRNRQIRRMCEKANVHIEKLKRIRIAHIHLGTLEPKMYRALSSQEVATVLQAGAF